MPSDGASEFRRKRDKEKSQHSTEGQLRMRVGPFARVIVWRPQVEEASRKMKRSQWHACPKGKSEHKREKRWSSLPSRGPRR